MKEDQHGMPKEEEQKIDKEGRKRTNQNWGLGATPGDNGGAT